MSVDQAIKKIILEYETRNQQQAIASLTETSKRTESLEKQVQSLARAYDPYAKQVAELARVQRISNALTAQGMEGTSAWVRQQQTATLALEKFNKAHNDNNNSLRSHEWVNFSRQLQDVAVGLYSGQHAMTVFAQQGAQMYDILASRQGGFMNGLKALTGSIASMVTPMRVLGVAAAATFAAIEIGASMAQNKLTQLGAQSRRTGVSASGIVGAQGVGAGAGLSTEETNSAIAQASKQFEQFKRNSGEVLDFLKKFDASALPAIDKARTFQEWIAAIGAEAQRLGGEKGLDLAQRLLGEDQGRLLVDNMDAFLKSMKGVAPEIDSAAASADALSRQLAQANAEVDEKMLGAFSQIATLSADIQSTWLGIKSAFADVVSSAGQAYRAMRSWIPDWTSPTGFLQTPQQLPDITIGGKTAGQNRAGYPDKAKKSGSNAAEQEQAKYDKVIGDLQQQIRLVNAVGDAHKEVQFEIEKENWLEKLGAKASEDHKQNVLNLAETLRAAREEQEKLNEKVKNFNEAYSAAASTVSGALKDIIHGGKPGDALKKGLNAFGDNALDAVLTGSGPLAKMFGMDNKTGGVGGIFGGIASMFGLGGKDVQTQTMNVNATTVNVGDSGVGGLAKGLMGDAAKGAGGFLSGIGDFFSSIMSALPFAEGGIMTSAGPVPLRKYAGGGIANSPQMALFGEGSKPEAYVPLPDGRRIPVAMQGGASSAPNINVHNYGGAQVEARAGAGGDIEILIDRKIAANNSRLPGMLRDHQRRTA